MNLARAAIGLAVCWSFPTLAEPPQSADAPTLTEMVASYTQCLVRNHHDQAREYILSSAATSATRDKFPVRDQACRAAFRGEEVSFIVDMYRDGLAVALVKADFGGGHVADITDLPILDQPVSLSGAAHRKTTDLRSQERVELAWLGGCIVRADPEAARQWVLVSPGSSEDLRKRTAMQATFDRCNQQAKLDEVFNPDTMLGPVALSYYRLASMSVTSRGAIN